MILADGRELHGHAVDISLSGICVHTDGLVTPKTNVEFRLWVVLPERETDDIVIPGRIVWATAVEGRMQLGAVFDRDIDNRSWARLDVLLQFFAGNLDGTDRL